MVNTLPFDSLLGHNAPVTLLIHFYTMPLIQLLLFAFSSASSLVIVGSSSSYHILSDSLLNMCFLFIKPFFHTNHTLTFLHDSTFSGGDTAFMVAKFRIPEDDGFRCDGVKEGSVMSYDDDCGAGQGQEVGL